MTASLTFRGVLVQTMGSLLAAAIALFGMWLMQDRGAHAAPHPPAAEASR